MMDVKEVRTQVVGVKDKMLSGDVTVAKTTLLVGASICVLVGMTLGLCKSLKICAKQLEKKEKKEDCNCPL